MSNIQQTVDELRFILQREVIERSDELTGLVSQYSGYCHDCNVRLRRCDEYIKQGLRSEALHLAEASPNLLDAVAILDFPEREELVDLLSMYFLDPPEPLLHAVAAVLNSTYSEHEPLERLLDLHRLLAVARAPLSQRLAVLRSLSNYDSASAHWDSDIRDMERARFSELNTESLSAAKVANAEKLKSLVDEVESLEWLEPVPASLIREVKIRASQTVRGNARQRLEELNDQLHSAFSALDVETARSLREKWRFEQQLGRLTEKDPLFEQVAPIMSWLDDEERKAAEDRAFSSLVAEIERSLDDEGIGAIALKKLQLSADRYNRRLPSNFETRLRSRLNTLEVIEGRRRKMIFAGWSAAVFVVVGIFGSIVYLSMEGQKTRRLVDATSAFIDEGNLAEAAKLIERQAGKETSEAWISVKKKLSDAEQTERDRIINWKNEVAIARESTETIAIEAALRRARELSKTAEEKIEVGQLQSAWQKRVNEATKMREGSFRESLALATEALTTLDNKLSSADVLDPKDVTPLLSAAESKIAALVSLRSSVAKELQSQAALLEARLKASRQTVSDSVRRSELFDKMTEAALLLPGTSQAAVNRGRFEDGLRTYAADLPNDPRATQFQTAAENCALPAAYARQELFERWKRLRPKDKADAVSRQRELRSFFTIHPEAADRELLSQYEDYLTSIIRRFEEDGDPDEGVAQRMHSLFNSPFIKEAHVLYDVDGHTYYLNKPQTTEFGSIAGISYVVGFNRETNQISLKPEKLLTLKSMAPPQQDLAAKVRSGIRNVTFEGWREYFSELTETLLKADKLDPFLRYLLVLKTVEFAGLGDRFLELELAPLLQKLSDDEIDRSVVWMDPLSRSADAARVRARQVLMKLPPVEPFFSGAAKREEQFEKELFAPRFAIGWLEKLSTGEWACRTKWSPKTEYLLHVAIRPDVSSPYRWTTVGRIRSTSTTVDAGIARMAGEGSVVFASAPTADKETALAP